MSDPFRREMRFAVSMVGGTSLAVHMNGTAQELQAMAQLQGLYGKLAEWTDTKPVIDVLSGTSAGGINAILLSAALTNQTNVEDSQAVFENWADIDKLMYPITEQADSLLQGEDVLYPALEQAFKKLAGEKNPQFPFKARDLDLYVTGTYLQGFPQTYFDSSGGRIYTHQHRGVFHFQKRGDRNDFAGPGKEILRLARAGRTTSSLPAVFETSKVCKDDFKLPPGQEPIIEIPVDHVWMGDGGYLNGRPLDLVVEAIARKPIRGREVVRKVLLVEPHPDPFKKMELDENGPSPLRHILKASSVSSKQSLHGVLREIDQHNENAFRLQRALNAAQDSFWVQEGAPPSSTAVDIYVSTLKEEIVQTLRGLWGRKMGIRTGDTVAGQTPAEERAQVSRRAKQLRELLAEPEYSELATFIDITRPLELPVADKKLLAELLAHNATLKDGQRVSDSPMAHIQMLANRLRWRLKYPENESALQRLKPLGQAGERLGRELDGSPQRYPDLSSYDMLSLGRKSLRAIEEVYQRGEPENLRKIPIRKDVLETLFEVYELSLVLRRLAEKTYGYDGIEPDGDSWRVREGLFESEIKLKDLAHLQRIHRQRLAITQEEN